MKVRRYRDPHDTAPRLTLQDQPLIAAIQGGLPLVPRPYAAIAAQIGWSEGAVLQRINELQQSGIIKRLGVVVRHRELGYRANAMVVWDVPDEEVAELGRCLSGFEFVTLCYRRPRHLPQWPYNLFCMIHGHDRAAVLEKTRLIIDSCGLEDIPKAVLFSRRRFKQRGAVYRPTSDEGIG
ncbi:MAG TPA: winged helix-turn-helix transcriptional regulator [Gammaproteobacteria bacterium]